MEDQEHIEWLAEHLQRLHLRPGDILVFRTQDILSAAAFGALRASMAGVFGDVPMIVLENGMELGVVNGEVEGVQ